MRTYKSTHRPKNISALLDLKITDLTTLKERLPGSVMVGLDIESFGIDGNQIASEVGLAVLQVHGRPTPFIPGLAQYYEENGVEALTIRLRNRGFKPQYEDPEYRFGDKVHASDEDVSDLAATMLAKYKGNKILVGFDMHVEMKWISETCPSLAPLFSAWVDVQELVSQRRKQDELGPHSDINHPGLSKTLRAMRIADWRSRKKRHCAANDALRNLIVLSGLVFHAPMDPPPLHDTKVYAFTILPKARGWRAKYRFTVKITTQDGSKLPLYSPNALREMFSRYSDFKAVAANWTTKEQQTEGVRIWYVAFNTQESLEQFIVDIDGSLIDDTRVYVVPFSDIGKTWSKDGNVALRQPAVRRDSDLLLDSFTHSWF